MIKYIAEGDFMTNIICGVLKSKRKFYFTFDADSKILTMQPQKMSIFPNFIVGDDFEDFSLSKERINIKGETNNKNYIEFIDVKFSSIGRGCFQAWVPAYIIGKSNTLNPIPKPSEIKNISFKGECIDRFMTSKCTVTDKWDYKDKKLQVNIDYGNDKIKKFSYKGLEFSFVPGWTMISAQKDVNSLLTMQTSLNIKSGKKLSVKSIIELYKDVEKLFSFVCYRQHVKFDSIILTQVEPVIFNNVPQDTAINFELHVSSDDREYDLPKVGRHMILRDYIDKVPEIIKCILEDDHMLLSFPDNSLKINIIDNLKYISISSAFESEFDLLYPEFKSNKNSNYKEAKDNLMCYLINESNNKKNNSHIRKYYKDFSKFVDDFEGRLEEQILHIFKEYSYIVNPERKYYEREYPNITFDDESLSKAFASKRNNLSHGSKLERFKILEIASYTIVRKINYAMLLKRSGFENSQIQEIVNQIF